MLRNLNEMEGCAIRAADGDIGDVKDFYIDDGTWVIRYLVVETGSWLSSRKVLVSPMSLAHADWHEKAIAASISREQVRASPDIDTALPVSRQHETNYLDYFAYPLYWGGTGLWGNRSHPDMTMPEFVSTPTVVQPQVDDILAGGAPAAGHTSVDPHLRSCNTITGYHIHATDGDIGHVKAMLFDDETWAIRYLVVDTSNWWLGHQVLIAPEWIDDVSWEEGTVSLTLSRQRVKDAPPYDAAFKVDRMHEIDVYKHYGSMAYWVKEQSPDAPRAVSPR